MRYDLGSDNTAGMAPAALQALIAANDGYARAYGADDITSRAAEQIRLPAAPDVLAALREIQQRHADAVASGDARAAFRANMAFHEALFAACGNRHLLELIQMMAQKVHGARSFTAASPEHLALARDEHFAMIAALDAADRPRLVALCRAHLAPSRDAYIAAVEKRLGGR